jgi:putative transposase
MSAATVFFHPTLVRDNKGVLLNRQSWEAVVELSTAIADFETFDNPTRRHSSLDYLTPAEFEALHSTKTPAAFL